MTIKAFAAAVLAVFACAQTQEEKDAYPDYAVNFHNWGITWETEKVHTEDGYILTMWHITGKEDTGPFEVTKPTVIFQHGMGGTAINWTMTLNGKQGTGKHVPAAFHLAEMGFDVWLTNNSGAEYSQEHDVYTTADKEYWQMDWTKYGLYDFPAAVKVIQERTGVEKVAVVGHSQGTTQTYAGMALNPEWYDKNVSVAAMLGPCTSPSPGYFVPLFTKEIVDFMDENGIWVISGGPDWAAKRELIMNSGIPDLVEALPSIEGLKNNPVQAVNAYAQAALSERFQRYNPDWFEVENPKTELMDIGAVKEMKVAMYVGLFDATCPLTVAREQHRTMGDKTSVHFKVAPW